MSTIVFGECSEQNLFQRWDADAANEMEFEYVVAKALMCVYPDYQCIVFGGSLKLDNVISKPDLALIAKDLSHWFVIEVELTSHSLANHVLPQVRAFQYGEAQPDCVTILAREIGLPANQIQTFLKVVPRSVAVVANKHNRDWAIALESLQVQFLTVSAFKSSTGVEAVEVDGRLAVLKEHLGFGVFSATDRSLRFANTGKLLDGEIMVDDTDGVGSMWTVLNEGIYTWVTKNAGIPDFQNGSLIQLVRDFRGRLSVRRSSHN
ncbi:MAG: hypothetical protein JWP25_3681 [Bradyrhizobium sp.]|nr:hypothetical protein [Bradyrhizobium sp.]